MKLTDEQRELIAFIPKAIIDSKEITTDSAKLVLGNIIKWYNTEFTKSNGYMFRTNKEMAEDCKIHPNSVDNATTLLVLNEYITKKSGKFKGEANEYTLTPKCGIKWGSQINEEGSQMGTQMDKGTQMNGELINRIEQLENEVLELKKELNELRGVHNNNCATESDTDIDIKNTQCIVHELENKNEKYDDMKINEDLIPQSIKDGYEVLEQCDEFDYTQFNDIADMVHRDAQGGKKCIEDNKSKYAERNVWITKLFTNIQDLLDVLSKCYDKGMISGKYGYAEDLLKYFNSGDKKVELGWFTEKQILKYQGYKNRYNALIEDRNKRFAGTHSDKDIEDKATVSNGNIISTGTSDSDEGGGCAAPSIEYEDNMMIMSSYMSEDEIAQLSKKSTTQHEEKKYGKYDSVDEWLKAFDEKWGLTTQEPMVSYNTNINAINYGQC